MKKFTDLKQLLTDCIMKWECTNKNEDRDAIELYTEEYLKSVDSLTLGKPEPLEKNKQTRIFKHLKCNHCGKRFSKKTHHRCNTGYRKYKHSWSVIERCEEKADATSR